MSPEQQRIAIAEACGWRHIQYDNKDYWEDAQGFIQLLPDYLNDLNAMHSAWLTLSLTQKFEFNRQLAIIIGFDLQVIGVTIHYYLINMCNAGCSQRVKAFLKTIGKWVE